MKQILCLGCRDWFHSSHRCCPGCGRPRPGFNKWLRTAQLNNHLFSQVESAEREKKRERTLYG